MQEKSVKNGFLRVEHYSFRKIVVKSDKNKNHGTKVLAHELAIIV